VPDSQPAWPYPDADRNDPLTALRIPVTGAWPGRGYLAAYGGQAERFLKWPRPDEAEIGMLASYIDYQRSKYPPHVQARMLAQLLDTCDLSALVFVKRGEGDWAYRRAHWTETIWSPPPENCGGTRLSLLALFDHVETSNGATAAPNWQRWKAAHSDTFGEMRSDG
jgi:hypothetical protein